MYSTLGCVGVSSASTALLVKVRGEKEHKKLINGQIQHYEKKKNSGQCRSNQIFS